MNTREDKLLRLCCRRHGELDLLESAQTLLACEEFDWNLFQQNAANHGVAPLVFQTLRQYGARVPASVLHALRLSLMGNMQIKEKRVQRLVSAMPMFHEAGITVMVIKGFALDLAVYPNPYLTQTKDYDIVLKVQGRSLSPKIREQIHHHFFQSAVEYDFDTHHDITMNGMLPVKFDELWSRAKTIPIRGHDVCIMSPEDMLLAACINSCRKRFVKLKSLLDIQEIIAHYGLLDWQTFAENARRYGCQNIVYAALGAVELLLGKARPQTLADQLQVGQIRRRIIDHLLKAVMRYGTLDGPYNAHHRVIDRQLDLFVLVPYATYSLPQVRYRLRQIQRA